VAAPPANIRPKIPRADSGIQETEKSRLTKGHSISDRNESSISVDHHLCLNARLVSDRESTSMEKQKEVASLGFTSRDPEVYADGQ
jgi:hypothetical protein